MRFISYIAAVLFIAASAYADTVKIAFLASDKLNPSNAAIFNGARDAFKELGSRFDKNFELVYVSADQSPQKQINQVNNLFLNQYGGAIIYAVHGTQKELSKLIPKLRESGFFMASVGAEIPDSQCVYHVGTDSDLFAQYLEREITILGGGRLKEVLCYFHSLSGSKKLSLSDKAEIEKLIYPHIQFDQFEKIFKPFGPYKMVEMAHYAIYSQENKVEILRYDNYGEVFFSPEILASMAPIPNDSDRRFAICLGALPQLDFYLKTRQLDAVIFDDYYGWGYYGARALAEKIIEGTDAENPKRLLRPLLAKPSTAKSFADDWVRWLK